MFTSYCNTHLAPALAHDQGFHVLTSSDSHSVKRRTLKVRKYAQQNHATCRATVLRCKLQSDVARISTLVTTCHATKKTCCRLKNFVAKSRKYFYFLWWKYEQHRSATCNATNATMLRDKLHDFVARISAP